MLAPLSRVESLHLFCDPCPIPELLQIPSSRLRNFSFNLYEGSPSEFSRLCSLLAGLERLKVAPTNSAAVGLVPHLSLLTRLSGLCIQAASQWHGRVSASFLTSLTGLVDLKLNFILSPNNAKSDISCLVKLTIVESVDHVIAYVISSTERAEGPSQQQHVLVNCGDLRPLDPLRLLEAWDLSRAWHWEGEDPNAVVAELRGFRGYPTGHGVSRSMWPSLGYPSDYTP